MRPKSRTAPGTAIAIHGGTSAVPQRKKPSVQFMATCLKDFLKDRTEASVVAALYALEPNSGTIDRIVQDAQLKRQQVEAAIDRLCRGSENQGVVERSDIEANIAYYRLTSFGKAICVQFVDDVQPFGLAASLSFWKRH